MDTCQSLKEMEIGDQLIAYPTFCARCHVSWLGKVVKELCPKCRTDDMVFTVERPEAKTSEK